MGLHLQPKKGVGIYPPALLLVNIVWPDKRRSTNISLLLWQSLASSPLNHHAADVIGLHDVGLDRVWARLNTVSPTTPERASKAVSTSISLVRYPVQDTPSLGDESEACLFTLGCSVLESEGITAGCPLSTISRCRHFTVERLAVGMQSPCPAKSNSSRPRWTGFSSMPTL